MREGDPDVKGLFFPSVPLMGLKGGAIKLGGAVRGTTGGGGGSVGGVGEVLLSFALVGCG
jgi:hypothetical protein